MLAIFDVEAKVPPRKPRELNKIKTNIFFSSFSRSGGIKLSSGVLFLLLFGNKALQHRVSISIGLSIYSILFLEQMGTK